MSKTFGIGTVRVRIFDGMMRALENVCHVPNLKIFMLIFVLDWRAINS